MPLVDYSDSESEDGKVKSSDGHSLPLKRKSDALDDQNSDTSPPSKLPPLPAVFYDLYATNTRVSVRDDPSLHGGRKRSAPHVEGNWPTHVYLECMRTLNCHVSEMK